MTADLTPTTHQWDRGVSIATWKRWGKYLTWKMITFPLSDLVPGFLHVFGRVTSQSRDIFSQFSMSLQCWRKHPAYSDTVTDIHMWDIKREGHFFIHFTTDVGRKHAHRWHSYSIQRLVKDYANLCSSSMKGTQSCVLHCPTSSFAELHVGETMNPVFGDILFPSTAPY